VNETGARSLGSYLQGVAAVCFAVDHLHYILIHRLSRLVSITPVIRRTYTILANIEVFWVVDVFVWTRLDTV